jgi:Methyltransferase domain
VVWVHLSQAPSLPASPAILEIAPGFGRWTRYLLPASEKFVGIDLSDKCIAACQRRFAGAKHAQFVTNDGRSLEAAEDRTFDLIFSFDSLVHAEYDILAFYIPQIISKLSSTGVAFIHHSNLLTYNGAIGQPHGRALTVSADAVADLVYRASGTVLVQEIVNWGGEHLIDCLSLFSHKNTFPSVQPIRHKNPTFMGEATLIKDFQSPYSRLAEPQSKTNAVPLQSPDAAA